MKAEVRVDTIKDLNIVVLTGSVVSWSSSTKWVRLSIWQPGWAEELIAVLPKPKPCPTNKNWGLPLNDGTLNGARVWVVGKLGLTKNVVITTYRAFSPQKEVLIDWREGLSRKSGKSTASKSQTTGQETN